MVAQHTEHRRQAAMGGLGMMSTHASWSPSRVSGLIPPPRPRIARSAAAEAWPRRYARFLRVTDAAVVLSCILGSYAFAPSWLTDGAGAEPFPGILAVLGLAWIVALGAYRSREASVFGVGSDEYKRVVTATMHVFGGAAMVMFILQVEFPGALFGVVLSAGILGLLASRWLSRTWLKRQRRDGLYLTPAVVVGKPEDVRYVARRIAEYPGAAYNVLGVALPGGRRGQSLTVQGERLPVLCSTDDVVRTVALKHAAAVIVAGHVPGGTQYIRELGWRLEEHGVELVLSSGLTNVAGPRIHWRPVEGLPLMEAELPYYSGAKHWAKRGLDIVLAACALLALSPLLLALALVVRLDSGGPILFRQERIGRGGAPFRMVTFRTMVPGAEALPEGLTNGSDAHGVLFTMRDDPRITRCGRWMRRYSLDELPQLFNVLEGTMSLVGPRPPLPREVADREGYPHRRMLIKPGITGLWLSNGRSELSWDDAVRLDLYYVENWSLTGDLRILWRAFRAIVDPVGAS
ncbi:sugar transferase [Sinomonas mesophila]|uniref:sugar transferase n=1 Tax=Sinomonas mesophila TaxID=1531955 RepID=UPI0011155CDA|nr:sugar transferase [Sinomonas mesophila]